MPKQKTQTENLQDLLASGMLKTSLGVVDSKNLNTKFQKSPDRDMSKIRVEAAKQGWRFSEKDLGGESSTITASHPEYGVVNLGDLKDQNVVSQLLSQYNTDILKERSGGSSVYSEKTIMKKREQLRKIPEGSKNEKDIADRERLKKEISSLSLGMVDQQVGDTGVDYNPSRMQTSGERRYKKDSELSSGLSREQKAVASALSALMRTAEDVSFDDYVDIPSDANIDGMLEEGKISESQANQEKMERALKRSQSLKVAWADMNIAATRKNSKIEEVLGLSEADMGADHIKVHEKDFDDKILSIASGVGIDAGGDPSKAFQMLLKEINSANSLSAFDSVVGAGADSVGSQSGALGEELMRMQALEVEALIKKDPMFATEKSKIEEAAGMSIEDFVQKNAQEMGLKGGLVDYKGESSLDKRVAYEENVDDIFAKYEKFKQKALNPSSQGGESLASSASAEADRAIKNWPIVRGMPEMLKHEMAMSSYFQRALDSSGPQFIPSGEINKAYGSLQGSLKDSGKNLEWWKSKPIAKRTSLFKEISSSSARDASLEEIWKNRGAGAGTGFDELKTYTDASEVSVLDIIRDIETDIKSSFDKFDYNKDSVLSRQEIESMSRDYNPSSITSDPSQLRREMAGTGSKSTTKILQSLLAKYDQDGNTGLSRSEIFKTVEGEDGQQVERLNNQIKQELITTADSPGGIVQKIDPGEAGLELAVRKYFSGGNPVGLLSQIASPVKSSDGAEPVSDKYREIAKGLISDVPYHSILAEKGMQKEIESKKAQGTLHELWENNKFTNQDMRDLTQVDEALKSAQNKALDEGAPMGEANNAEEIARLSSFRELLIKKAQDSRKIEQYVNQGQADGSFFDLALFMQQKLGNKYGAGVPKWTPNDSIHSNVEQYRSDYFGGVTAAAQGIDAVQTLNLAQAGLEGGFGASDITSLQNSIDFEKINQENKKDKEIVDKFVGKNLQSKLEGFEAGTPSISSADGSGQRLTNISNPLDFIINYTKKFNEQQKGLRGTTDQAQKVYQSRSSNQNIRMSEYDQQQNQSSNKEVYNTMMSAASKELAHRKLIEPSLTIDEVLSGKPSKAMMLSDFGLGETYKGFLSNFSSQNFVIGPDGQRHSYSGGNVELGKGLMNLYPEEMKTLAQSYGWLDKEGNPGIVLGNQLTEDKIAELIGSSGPAQKYVKRAGEGSEGILQSEWKKTYGGRSPSLEGLKNLTQGAGAKLVITSSSQADVKGLPSGGFTINRAEMEDGELKSGEVLEEVGVIKSKGTASDNPALMHSIAKFAQGDRSDSSFVGIYEKLDLPARERLKSKYRDLIEQNVPVSVKDQLNKEIAAIDKRDLFSVAAGDDLPVSDDIKRKLKSRQPLSREEQKVVHEARRKKGQARQIVNRKRTARGVSSQAGRLMDDLEYNECLARLVSASSGSGIHQGIVKSDSMIKEISNLTGLPTGDERARVRYSGGELYNEEHRQKKLEEWKNIKQRQLNRFKSTVQSDERFKNWFVFDNSDLGFRENEEYCNLQANKVRRPVLVDIPADVRVAAKNQLGANLPAKRFKTEGGQVMTVEEELASFQRMEGTGPFGNFPPQALQGDKGELAQAVAKKTQEFESSFAEIRAQAKTEIAKINKQEESLFNQRSKEAGIEEADSEEVKAEKLNKLKFEKFAEQNKSNLTRIQELKKLTNIGASAEGFIPSKPAKITTARRNVQGGEFQDFSNFQKSITNNLKASQINEKSSLMSKTISRSSFVSDSRTLPDSLMSSIPSISKKTAPIAELEIASSKQAGYQKPVQAKDVGQMNIPGEGRTLFNSQESIVKMPGVRQPFIIPPKESKASRPYAKAVQTNFGFNPYDDSRKVATANVFNKVFAKPAKNKNQNVKVAAEGFVPNFASPNAGSAISMIDAPAAIPVAAPAFIPVRAPEFIPVVIGTDPLGTNGFLSGLSQIFGSFNIPSSIAVAVPRSILVDAPSSIGISASSISSLQAATQVKAPQGIKIENISPIPVNAPRFIGVQTPDVIRADIPERIAVERPGPVRVETPQSVRVEAPTSIKVESPQIPNLPPIGLAGEGIAALSTAFANIPQSIGVNVPQSIGVNAPPFIPVQAIAPITVNTPTSIRVDVPQSIRVDAPQSIKVDAPESIPVSIPDVKLQVETPTLQVNAPESIPVDAPNSIPVDVGSIQVPELSVDVSGLNAAISSLSSTLSQEISAKLDVAGSIPVSLTGSTNAMQSAVQQVLDQFGEDIRGEIIEAIESRMPQQVKVILDRLRNR